MLSFQALAPLSSDSAIARWSEDAGPGGRGILVVDDTEMIRSMLKLFFRDQGLPCWLASNGADALNIYQAHGQEIALVLLDVRMPGLDGPHTYVQLRSLNPDVACYFMSGGWDPYTAEGLMELGARGLLSKPFVIADLPGILKGFRLGRSQTI